MAKKFFDIGLWVEDANKIRTVLFVHGRFDLKQNVLFVEGKGGPETAFPLRFKPHDFIVDDFFRAVLNFDTGTVTPLPEQTFYADPVRDPGVSSLVTAGVRLANQAAAGLERITSTITGALNAGVIPAALHEEIERAQKQWMDAPSGNPISVNFRRKAKVNLVKGGTQIICPVHLRVGKLAMTVKSRIDSGAEVSVISPEFADKLHAPVIGSMELGGFTGGSAIVPLVELEAIVNHKHVIPVEAAVSDLVKRQTGRDFLAGAGLILAAKEKGESMI